MCKTDNRQEAAAHHREAAGHSAPLEGRGGEEAAPEEGIYVTNYDSFALPYGGAQILSSNSKKKKKKKGTARVQRVLTMCAYPPHSPVLSLSVIQ